MTGIAGCCARADSGHAAAPPSVRKSSRRVRLIVIRPDCQGLAVQGEASVARRRLRVCDRIHTGKAAVRRLIDLPVGAAGRCKRATWAARLFFFFFFFFPRSGRPKWELPKYGEPSTVTGISRSAGRDLVAAGLPRCQRGRKSLLSPLGAAPCAWEGPAGGEPARRQLHLSRMRRALQAGAGERRRAAGCAAGGLPRLQASARRAGSEWADREVLPGSSRPAATQLRDRQSDRRHRAGGHACLRRRGDRTGMIVGCRGARRCRLDLRRGNAIV